MAGGKKLPGRLDHLDISPEELITALNDKSLSDALLKAKGWTREDLLRRADLLSKELAAAISAVNVV
ncbi:hypothetical protein [Rhizobium lentis]|uniref:Uncharacterized protein n=1 Tax=Rhizobium lentis TaxID=1138194 RepID=A0A7W8XKG2_9HYPH|nr:hypothetical protein [Rhizobium lentis]MBB4577127.1 hypothetical protein [Rhizobium lentis]MBB5553968.1 hypothetical protein [Rhizobium lentis]MBB5564530.1 hypothetical protein [Rhizobium lentis]MBB5571046.1 hypothetical protein [Rhizobium lentis]